MSFALARRSPKPSTVLRRRLLCCPSPQRRIAGISGRVVKPQYPTLPKHETPRFYGLVLCALPFVPARYDAGYATPRVGRGQPTAIAVRRLTPNRSELASNSVRLAWALRPSDLCYYLSVGTGTCVGVRALLAIDDPAVLDQELRRLGTTHFYLDERTPGRAAKGLESAGLGWTRVAPADRRERWILLRAEARSLQ